MKKTILTMALLVAGFAASYAVDYTAKAFITMDGTVLKLREATTMSAGYKSGEDVANANVDKGIFAVATITGSTDTQWSQFGTNDLEGLQIAFKPAAASVAFNISGVSGADLYLVDATDNSKTKLVDGATITVNVAATEVGTVVTGRFSLSKVAPVIQEFCFNYDKLTVKGYNGKSIKITSKEGSLIDQKTAIGDSYEYDFIANGKPAGRYIVEFDLDDNGTAEEYQIDVKPAVH